MDQLIGSNCVACQQRITNILEAENCQECGNPIHKTCIRQMEAGDGLEVCHRCGYAKLVGSAPVQYPFAEQQPGSNGTALVVLGSIISIVGIALLIGNISGLFRTFPFAGFITLLIGGAIAGAGRRS